MAFAGTIYREAAQMQTGIPTGVPSEPASSLPGVADALKNVATEGGILGALLVIAIGAIVTLWLSRNKADAAHAEERKDWQPQIDDLHDARLADQREIVTALNNATGVISVNSQRMAESASSAHDIATKIGEVVFITKANAESIGHARSAIEHIARNPKACPPGGGS